ncbi:hypothetical protein INT43_008010 [Umbelopsis isabellina]|uniref:GH16 domain-containing protein n=1 Tax=Mortierella isabellina TaxID=91625 RepID=A0A8H7UEW1_MORIS|nr:hypothetical protein INT43_008010 [Umbelopsis isabellina]
MVFFHFSSVIALTLAVSTLNVTAAAVGKRDGATIDKRPSYTGIKAVDNCQSFTEKFDSLINLHQRWSRNEDPKPGLGPGSLFSSKRLMQYGFIEVKMKSASAGGLEWVGDEVQTAYYYQGIPDFSKAAAKVLKDQSTEYHTYAIEWQPIPSPGISMAKFTAKSQSRALIKMVNTNS